MAPAIAGSTPPSDAFRFLYDTDGHLKAAIDPDGDTATYNWDAAGNLLSIGRSPSGKLSVLQLTPPKAAVGEMIEIEGTGFSETPASNTVKFNGTPATVEAATPWSLTVRVPAEATAGTVTVQTPGEGPVTSAQSFTIVGSSKPSISSIAPNVAAAGEEVTISGTNFEPAPIGNVVTINGSRPELVAASSEAIKFKVSPGRLGGGVSVSTPEGSSASVDLFVPPVGVAASKVGTTGRFALGASKTVEFAGSEKVALLLFDATARQRASLVLSESTITSGSVSIWTPSGTQLSSASYSKSSGGAIETASLPAAGTYTVLLSPSGASSGSVKVTSFGFQDQTATVTPAATAEGTTQGVEITAPGQNARFSVTMTAGEKVSLRTNNSNMTGSYAMKWLKPNGTSLYSVNFSAKENWFWDSKLFSEAGTYTLEVDPSGTSTGTVDLQLWETPDITGQTIEPSAEGDSATATIDVPGSRELITFAGTAAQLVTVKAEESTIASGTMRVLKPDGSQLSGSEASFSTGSNAKRELTLPTTGTYTIVIDPPTTGSQPVTNGTGSVKATVYLGSHVAWFAPIEPTTQLVSFSTRALPETPGYSDIASRSQMAVATQAAGSDRTAARRGSDSHGHRRAIERYRVHSAPRASNRQIEGHHPQALRGDIAGDAAGRDETAGYAGHGRQRAGTRFVTGRMHAFRPAAVKVWKPPRHIPGWEAAEPDTPWTDAADLQASPGTTAVAGQVLQRNGLPLAGVRVSAEGTSTDARTDEAGRFLLAELPAGDQTLVVNGESVPGDRRYGSYEVNVELENQETTVLDYTIWLSPLDPAGDQRVAPPTKRETHLTTPSIPGLEVRIPKGTVIRDTAGKVVKDLNITAIPVNQAPFPLPPFVPIPVYFTVQPGSAYLSKGAQIVYPNWGDLRPGQRAEFWNYDAQDRGWYVYGRGTVSADGKQVVPDPGVRVWQFTGAMLAASPVPPATAPNGTASGGDPVDLHSGLFTYHKRDLILPSTIPIDIQRTYRPNDSNSYSFGIGTTNPYDLRLWSGAGAAEANLIMPDGQRIHYVRTTPGTGYSDGIYESTSTPGPFFASTLKYAPAGGGAYWDLELTNGMTYVFGVGRLLEVRDSHGNALMIARSGENITQITSPNGRWVKFSYDGSYRITELTDNGGRHFKYSYTSRRLTKVEAPGERTTEYEYDASGRMKAVINPRGNKYLQNEYDASGRVKKQTMGDGGTYEFAYELDEAGNVKATTITDQRGYQRKLAFNPEGFPVSETAALGTEAAQTTTWERQPETGLVLSQIDPLGRKTEFEYDSSGNVKEMTRLADTEDAVTTKLEYQPGTTDVTKITDPLGHATSFEYGATGELIARADALENQTTFTYNGDGQLATLKDPEGNETKFAYETGTLATVTDHSVAPADSSSTPSVVCGRPLRRAVNGP